MAVTTTTGLPVHQIDTVTYLRIVASGALDEQRVELLDGIITDMSPHSPEHAAIIQRLTRHLAPLAAQGLLRVQLPLQVAAADSLPEPDVAVTSEPADVSSFPRTAVFVVEVAVTSHDVDRGRKQQLYADTRVPMYWLVDVARRRVEVRSDPAAGRYRTTVTYEADDTVPPPLAGIQPLPVADLFD